MSVRLSVRAFAALVVMLCLFVALAPAQAQRVRPDFFGMHANDWTAYNEGVRVGSANFTVSGTYWSQLQPAPGEFEWTRLDAQLAAAESRNLRPVLILGGTPAWARDPNLYVEGGNDRAQVPRMSAWLAFVSAVVQRYRTRLDYQIWPEPNIKGNWLGGPERMATFTQRASQVIKREAKQARVISGPSVLRLRGERRWFETFITQRPGNRLTATWVDAVGVDPYPHRTGGPEASARWIQYAQTRLRKVGTPKPVWNTEINYGIGGYSEDALVIDEATQAAWVSRTYLLNAGLNVPRVYWLGWFRYWALGVNMLDEAGAHTTAATAHDVTRRWLLNGWMAGCSVTKGLYTCTIKHSTGSGPWVNRVYWHTSKRVRVRTHPSSIYRENILGNRYTKRGSYFLRVGQSPVMVRSRR